MKQCLLLFTYYYRRTRRWEGEGKKLIPFPRITGIIHQETPPTSRLLTHPPLRPIYVNKALYHFKPKAMALIPFLTLKRYPPPYEDTDI